MSHKPQSLKITLWKTASWALVSGVLIFGTAYYETRMVWASFMAALFAVLLKTPVYTLHDMIWERAVGKHHPVIDHLPESTVEEDDDEEPEPEPAKEKIAA
jgi:uncharacterized membrane protein